MMVEALSKQEVDRVQSTPFVAIMTSHFSHQMTNNFELTNNFGREK